MKRERDIQPVERKRCRLLRALYCCHRAGLRFCRCYLQKRSILSGPDELYQAPNAEFWFGTDTLGRDIFSCIWHGGRVSLLIGVASTALSTRDCHCLWCNQWNCRRKSDTLLMRFNGDYFKHPESAADYFPCRPLWERQRSARYPLSSD